VNSKTIVFCLLLVIVPLWLPVNAAGLIANVERKTVIDGETVVLYIEGEDLQNLPDTSALNQKFDILDSRVSNQQFRSGGKTTRAFTLRFELLPKHLGTSEIPSFESDGYISQPIEIDVVERGSPGAVPRDNVFAEITFDNDSPYVQSQVVMAIRIYDDGSLATADPEPPVIADVQIEALPMGEQEIEERHGAQYRVNTWRFALFPQKSGSVEIPAMQIAGSVKDASYGGNLILRNTPTRRISIRTKPATLEVRARPDESTSSWWLPVRQLELKHQWSSDIGQSQVGEPLTLSLSVTTRGATSTQLPRINLPEVQGLKVYPDVPELASQAADDGLISQRREKWSIIPQQAGTLELPAITLKWWDTVADIEREATLPAQQIVVAAAQGSNNDSEALTAQSTAPADAGEQVASDSRLQQSQGAVTEVADPKPAVMPATSRLWMWIAICAMFGWIGTIVSWLWRASRTRKQANDDQQNSVSTKAEGRSSQYLRELKSLSQQNNPVAFRDGLLSWGKAKWPDNAPLNLADIGGRLDNSALSGYLRALDAAVYSQRQNNSVSLPELYSALKSSVDKPHRAASVPNDPLPHL